MFNVASAQLDELSSYPKTCDSKEFKSKSGEDVYVKCDFTCYIEAELPENTLKLVTWNVMANAKYACKHPPTFMPKSLTFMDMDGKFTAVARFTAKNAYGVPDELTTYYTFDIEGNVSDL